MSWEVSSASRWDYWTISMRVMCAVDNRGKNPKLQSRNWLGRREANGRPQIYARSVSTAIIGLLRRLKTKTVASQLGSQTNNKQISRNFIQLDLIQLMRCFMWSVRQSAGICDFIIRVGLFTEKNCKSSDTAQHFATRFHFRLVSVRAHSFHLREAVKWALNNFRMFSSYMADGNYVMSTSQARC